MNQLKTPVAMMVFNRPENTRRVFAAIAVVRPTHLLLIADGPRASHPGEAERCEQVREIVTAVTWPCQVETNFASENMGCRARVISGLNWVFSLVEEAIILEDDCLPDQSFFPFCAELLERYRDQNQIGFIAGFNPMEKSFPFRYSYYYSLITWCWGWATWRRAWQQYDEHLHTWPEVKDADLLSLIFPDERIVAYWSRIFDAMYERTGPDTWDYQWVYTCWTRNWLSILPRNNLIQNTGFGVDATHTSIAEPDFILPAGTVIFPLEHPPAIIASTAFAMQMQKRFYARNIPRRVLRRLQMLFQSRVQ